MATPGPATGAGDGSAPCPGGNRPTLPAMLKHVAIACLIAAWAAAAVGLAGAFSGAGWPIAWAMAGFLAMFALGKGLMAVEKLTALRAVATGGADPRADFASPFLFWMFVAFKLLTWAVGWAVAAYLLAHPGAFTRPADGLVRADGHRAPAVVQALVEDRLGG